MRDLTGQRLSNISEITSPTTLAFNNLMSKHLAVVAGLVFVVWFLASSSTETDSMAVATVSSTSATTTHSPAAKPTAANPGNRQTTAAARAADDVPATANSSNATLPPLPQLPDATKKNPIERVLGEHFRSHPSTEERIWRLRELAAKTNDRASQRSEPPKRRPKDLIDFAQTLKNESARFGSVLFANVVGPLEVEEEWKLGSEIHTQLLAESNIDSAASLRVARLAEQLLPALKRTKDRDYTFTVLQNDTVNAFSHLGGHVYIHQGLLDLVKNDDELLFVLGHELAHVELGHCANASLPGIAAKRSLGDIAALPANLLNKFVGLSYSEEDEHRSDCWSYQTLRGLGKSDQQIISFFYTMMHDEQTRSR